MQLTLAPGHLLNAASWAYGVPLVVGLAAAAAAYGVNAADAITGAAALLGFAAGLFISHRRLRAADCLRGLQPAVERVD